MFQHFLKRRICLEHVNVHIDRVHRSECLQNLLFIFSFLGLGFDLCRPQEHARHNETDYREENRKTRSILHTWYSSGRSGSIVITPCSFSLTLPALESNSYEP